MINHLKAENFIVKKNQVSLDKDSSKTTPGMLLIWAEWCPWCHKFMPEYEKINKTLGKRFLCTAIEQTELKKNPKLSEALDFKYFPTIKFFDQSGSIVGEYSSKDRSAEKVLKEICNFYHHCIENH